MIREIQFQWPALQLGFIQQSVVFTINVMAHKALNTCNSPRKPFGDKQNRTNIEKLRVMFRIGGTKEVYSKTARDEARGQGFSLGTLFFSRSPPSSVSGSANKKKKLK